MAPIRETRERDKSRREKEAEYWFGLSKIVFTAMVVGSVMAIVQAEEVKVTLVVVIVLGLIITFGLYAIGHNTLTKS